MRRATLALLVRRATLVLLVLLARRATLALLVLLVLSSLRAVCAARMAQLCVLLVCKVLAVEQFSMLILKENTAILII